MWPGPVFCAELVALARRGLFYAARFSYGLFLLLIVVLAYILAYVSVGGVTSGPADLSIEALAGVGRTVFSWFAAFQGSVILVMTAPLVAGAIAEERQRQTLDYLLVSRLTAAEIVLGKVAARLLRMAVVFALGLPVLNLIAFCGGVDLELVLLVYAASATTAYFIAGVAILASVYAPRPREAVAQTYLLGLCWLVVPSALLGTMYRWSAPWRAIGDFCLPVLDWVATSSPGDLLRGGPIILVFSPRSLIPQVLWMMALQVVGGSAWIAIAAWRLRPACRGFDSPGLWTRITGGRSKRSRRRLWARPPVTDRAILWKEMNLGRSSDSRRVLMGIVGLVLVGLVAHAGWGYIRGAVDELRNEPFWRYGPNRQEINGFLRASNALVLLMVLVGVGSAAATSITAEREADTWTVLASSPVDGAEVVGGKIVGSLWRLRSLAYFLFACWGAGLAIGSIHPCGVLICVVELAAFAWFAAALGVAISLRARNGIQAITLTVLILSFANLSPPMVLMSLGGADRLLWFTCMPYLFASGLLRPIESLNSPTGPVEVLPSIVTGTIIYAVAALALTRMAIGGYDRTVDRPSKHYPELTAATVRRIFADRSPGSS